MAPLSGRLSEAQYEFRIAVRVNNESREVIEGQIPPDEWRALRKYLDYFDDLAATQLGARVQIRARIVFNADGTFSCDGELPAADDLAAFLHRLRPFVLENEPTYFLRVCAIIGRRVRHRAIHALLRRQRDEFSGKTFESQMQLTTNGQLVNCERVVRLWLNSYEYHRAADGRDQLARLHTLLPLETTKPLFVSMMIDKARAIREIATVIRLPPNVANAVARSGSESCQIRRNALSIRHRTQPQASERSDRCVRFSLQVLQAL